MDTKTTENARFLANEFINLVTNDVKFENVVDDLDAEPVVEPNKAQFTARLSVDEAVSDRRGPRTRRPTGQIVYRITVEATYESLED